MFGIRLADADLEVSAEGRVKARVSGLIFFAVDLPLVMAIFSNLAKLSAVMSGLNPKT